MKIYDFFKAVVSYCNNVNIGCVSSNCKFCPLQTIRTKNYYSSCEEKLFNYFIETDKTVGQKICDEFVRLDIYRLPNLSYFVDKKRYEIQLKVFEKYCKNNILEIE